MSNVRIVMSWQVFAAEEIGQVTGLAAANL